jgi:hypothetical protein
MTCVWTATGLLSQEDDVPNKVPDKHHQTSNNPWGMGHFEVETQLNLIQASLLPWQGWETFETRLQ